MEDLGIISGIEAERDSYGNVVSKHRRGSGMVVGSQPSFRVDKNSQRISSGNHNSVRIKISNESS